MNINSQKLEYYASTLWDTSEEDHLVSLIDDQCVIKSPHYLLSIETMEVGKIELMHSSSQRYLLYWHKTLCHMFKQLAKKRLGSLAEIFCTSLNQYIASPYFEEACRTINHKLNALEVWTEKTSISLDQRQQGLVETQLFKSFTIFIKKEINLRKRTPEYLASLGVQLQHESTVL